LAFSLTIFCSAACRRAAFELIVDLVAGQQFQAFLLGGEGEVVLPEGKVAVGEAVMRVRRRRVGFNVQQSTAEEKSSGLTSASSASSAVVS
jgi:hypothetical protein